MKLSDGARLHVRVIDAPDPVATVVLVHGYACDHRAWHKVHHVVPLAVSQPVRVIAYDHRGHGDSSAATVDTATVEQLGDDLAELVTQLAIGPVVLAGHGMGGLTVLAFAARHSALFAERVAGVVLLATSAGRLAETSAAWSNSAARLVADLEALFGPGLVQRVRQRIDKAKTAGLRWMLFGEDPDPEDVRLTAEMIHRHWPHTVALFRPALAGFDRRALPATKVVSVMGERDRLLPVLAEQDLVVLPGIGHMLPLEGAAEITPRIVGVVNAALRG
jgi:pimeloyl-ACP methyl ester carboxylesterase